LGKPLYNASGNTKIGTGWKFGEQGTKHAYNFFATGFILDFVSQIAAPAAQGAIPAQWFELGGWKDPKVSGPPEEFWRTLVADRDPDGHNALPNYAWALEHVVRQSVDGGAIDTSAIIERTGDSNTTEFLKRVQAVTWNRRLFRTARGGVLGLAPYAAREGDGKSKSSPT
jgi:hypothetical protein